MRIDLHEGERKSNYDRCRTPFQAPSYESTAEQLKALEQDILVRQARADGFADFLRIFAAVDSKLLDFDEKLWVLTIDKVKVMTDGTLHFIFQNGADIVA